MFNRSQRVIVNPVMPGLDDIAGKTAIIEMHACKNTYYIRIETSGERLYISGDELKAMDNEFDHLVD